MGFKSKQNKARKNVIVEADKTRLKEFSDAVFALELKYKFKITCTPKLTTSMGVTPLTDEDVEKIHKERVRLNQ